MAEPGRVALLEKDQIFYVEARLPSPPFFHVHRSYVVNLNRAIEPRSRGDDEWELRMDPPVNKVLPVSRRRLPDLRELLGI